MTEATRHRFDFGRSWLRGRLLLASVLSLGWARIGRFDVAIPAGLALIVAGFADQLGRPFGPVPFGLAWAIVSAGALAAGATASKLRLAGRLRPVALLVVPSIAGWCLFDVLLWQQPNNLYDLNVYLASAGRWLDGGQPYMTGPIAAWPTSPAADFFLYPPPLLPFFGLLSKLPGPLVSVGWVAFLVLCAFASFRALGLRPAWSLALVAFPPVMVGIESGNVAAFTFLLFALGFRAGGGLVLGALFKAQTALPALWLIRERRWRGLLAGVAALATILLLTLPLTGLGAWGDWLAGLGYRAESQPSVPSLYGNSLAQLLPGPLFVAMAAALVVAALLFRGRRGLAAFGLASIFASPSLWPHGFVFALPAVLMLESGTLVWILLGAAALNPSYWLLFYAGWLALLAARRPLPAAGRSGRATTARAIADRSHPMSGTAGPWGGR